MPGGVPDLHVDVLLVELRGVRVHLGDLGRVVVDEPPSHVPHDQRCKWRKRGNVVMERGEVECRKERALKPRSSEPHLP